MINTYDNNIDFLKATLTEDELEFIQNLPMWTSDLNKDLRKNKELGEQLINLIHILNNNPNYFKKKKLNISISVDEIDGTLNMITCISKNLTEIKNKFIEFDGDLRILLLTSQLEDVTDAIKDRITLNKTFYSSQQEIIKTKSMPVFNFIRLINIQGLNLDTLPTADSIEKIHLETEKKEEFSIPSIISNEVVEEQEKELNERVLRISELEGKVFLPYTDEELHILMEKEENEFKAKEQIVSENFVIPLEVYTKTPSFSRFKEAFKLIKKKENRSIFEALDFAASLMFNSSLNPAVIAACKSSEELEEYLSCLNTKTLNDFNLFKIVFEINPLKVN